VPTDRSDHLAACHFHESLIGVDASQLYQPTSLDTEDMTAADLPDVALEVGEPDAEAAGAERTASDGEASEG
jgi:hypothetical protein